MTHRGPALQPRRRQREGVGRGRARPRGRRGLRARGPSDHVEPGGCLEAVGLLTSWEQGSPGPSRQGHPPTDHLEQTRLLSRQVEPRTGTGRGFRPYTSVTTLCKEGLQVKAGLRGQQGRGAAHRCSGLQALRAWSPDLLSPRPGDRPSEDPAQPALRPPASHSHFLSRTLSQGRGRADKVSRGLGSRRGCLHVPSLKGAVGSSFILTFLLLQGHSRKDTRAARD